MLFVLPVTKEKMNIPKSYQVKHCIECLSIKCLDHAVNVIFTHKIKFNTAPNYGRDFTNLIIPIQQVF